MKNKFLLMSIKEKRIALAQKHKEELDSLRKELYLELEKHGFAFLVQAINLYNDEGSMQYSVCYKLVEKELLQDKRFSGCLNYVEEDNLHKRMLTSAAIVKDQLESLGLDLDYNELLNQFGILYDKDKEFYSQFSIVFENRQVIKKEISQHMDF